MAKKKKKKAAKAPPKAKHTPSEIVAAWRKRIEERLKPWFLERKCFTHFEPALKKNIEGLLANGAVFKPADMKNSLRVAGDAARICKILQPKPHPKEIRFDTFQGVLKLCAKQHKVCQGAGGGGGWCDV